MDYQQAAKIRKKSFGTLLAEQEGGLGQSLKAAISQKTQAKIKGIKEKFDPLNIIKAITGGSNFAPAFFGKLFGVDKKRIDYFSGVKDRHQKIENVESSQGGITSDTLEKATESLGYIYKSLKQSIADKKEQEELKRNQQEEENNEEEIRNQEIIQALTGKKAKKKQYRDEKGRFTKEPPKETTKGETPTGKPPKGETPTTKAPNVKVETPKNIPTQTPTTPVSSTPIIPSTVGRTIAVGAVAAIASRIARGESRGESKESYTQANIVGKEVQQAQIVKGNIDVTTGKPFDKSLNEMTIGEVIDLGKRRYNYYKVPDPKNPGKFIYRGGSAMGKYQFIPGTLADSAKKLYGEGWQNHVFDNQAQEDINASFILSNEEQLKKAGIPVTDASLYMMHFFGNTKQTAMVLNGNDNGRMSDILGDFASKQNPGVAKMSIAEYKQHLRKKGFDFQVVDLAESKKRVSELKSENNVGTKLDKDAQENKQLKSSASDESSSSKVNTNVNIQKSQQPSSSQTPADDTNNYLKKARQ